MTEGGELADLEVVARAAEDAQGALRAGAVSETAGLPEDLQFLAEKHQAQEIELKRRFAGQEYELRRTYARWIIVLLGAQLLLANAVFVAFSWAGQHWDLSTAVIDVWLGRVCSRACHRPPSIPMPGRSCSSCTTPTPRRRSRTSASSPPTASTTG